MGEIGAFAGVVLVVAAGGLVALASSGVTARLHVPAPVVFLLVASVAADLIPALGRELDIRDVERIGIVALIAILFDGGMHVGWRRLRPALRPVVALGTAGTLLTALLATLAAHVLLPVSWTTAAIVGAALAPTDPAVMFSVLSGYAFGGRAPVILEGESGANDPVSIALVIALVDHATGHGSVAGGVLGFTLAMVVGAGVGIGGGAAILRAARHGRLPRAGLHPLLTLAMAGVLYGAATLLHGSGFLAVFVAGVVVGDARMPYKADIERFHDAVASLSEIVVFAALGLTIHLRAIPASTTLRGLALAGVLVLVVRPLVTAVFLWPEPLRRGEKAFVAWAGFRGAVPILLAALAVIDGVAGAGLVYDVVFVVVSASVLVQGFLLQPIARRAGIPVRRVEQRPFDVSVRVGHEPSGMRRYHVAAGAVADGRLVRDLPIGEEAWISLVVRDARPVQPRGSLRLQAGDELLVLTDPGDRPGLHRIFEGARATSR